MNTLHSAIKYVETYLITHLNTSINSIIWKHNVIIKNEN